MIPLEVTDPIQRAARLRSLRIAARILCGPRAQELEAALARAERDPSGELPKIDKLIDALQPIPRWGLLSTWARTL